MNGQRTIETLPTEEFERIVEQFIAKAAGWDGALPAGTFLAAWEELVEDIQPLEVQATTRLTFPMQRKRPSTIGS
jgi:hypothetical protein